MNNTDDISITNGAPYPLNPPMKLLVDLTFDTYRRCGDNLNDVNTVVVRIQHHVECVYTGNMTIYMYRLCE